MIALTVLLFTFVNSVHASVIDTSNFSSGADGWTWDAPNPSMTWQPTGGNTDGYIRYDNNQGGGAWIHAPSGFLGNWNSLGVNELSYQVNIFLVGNVNTVNNLLATISGPGGDALWVGPQPDPGTPWKDIVVPISEESWTVNSGTWGEIMADVTDLSIAMAYYNNFGPFEITGIDNVSLNAVPIPAALPLFMSGVLFLSFARKKNRKA